MRYFDRKRRRLIKEYYLRGSKKSVEGTTEVAIESSGGVPLRSLRIEGNTVQEINEGEGIAPTPDTPIPIQNANSSGLMITVRGNNLFDSKGTLSDANFSEAKYRGFECIRIRPDSIAHRFPCSIPAGILTISFDYVGATNGTVNFEVYAILADKTIVYIGERGTNLDPTLEFSKFRYTKTFSSPVAFLEFRFFSIDTLKEYYFKNIMVNAGRYIEYQPYFCEKILIPTAMETDGDTLNLDMQSISISDSTGIYTATDSITVDGQAKRALYHKRVGKTILTADMGWKMFTAADGKTFFFTRNDINANNVKTPILSSHYTGCTTVFNSSKNSYGITTDSKWWDGNWKCALTIHDVRFNTLEAFLADIEANLPMIVYGLREEVIYDITDTEIGSALLSLTVPREADAVLLTQGDVPVSKIFIEYYSMQNEDKAKLTVIYENEVGESIKAPVEYTVRRGSKYQIVSPHIDGYIPISSEIYGVLGNDEEVILKYKENSDVSV